MTVLVALVDRGYLADLLAGMAVNFQIAAIALGLGLALGLPLGLMQLGGRLQRALVAPSIGLMRVAPTFVVMFFLLNVIPRDASLFGLSLALSAPMIVALSLVPYAAAYAADNGREAFRQLRGGSADSALLFLPNIARAFFVLVMSSSTGAAIGVSEGVAVVLREAERWSSLGEKLVVFGIGVLAFGVVFQIGLALMRVLGRRLARR
jgi:ABC-type arginine/histidine transport system permease subunit